MLHKYLRLLAINIIIGLFSLIQINSLLAVPSIVAIVNDNYVISTTDVEKYKSFLSIVAQGSLSNKEIIQVMITNYLILEDAKKFKINITKQELQEGIKAIATNKNISQAELYNMANVKNINNTEFTQLLKNELLTQKVKQTMAMANVTASSQEINSEVNRLLSLNGKKEYLLYEYTISNEETAQEIYTKISSTSENNNQYGRDIGWVPEIYLPSEVAQYIQENGIDKPTKPTLVNNKYKIYIVKAVRPLLQINTSNPEHLKQIENFAKQKIMFEKSQNNEEDYIQELYKKAYIALY